MPTRNVNLTTELDAYVSQRIETGRIESASEVVRAGLRALEHEEQEYEEKLIVLRAAIKHGIESGVAEGDVMARIRKKLKLPAKRSKFTSAVRKK
jgi:antitoxin ParD1/3/4